MAKRLESQIFTQEDIFLTSGSSKPNETRPYDRRTSPTEPNSDVIDAFLENAPDHFVKEFKAMMNYSYDLSKRMAELSQKKSDGDYESAGAMVTAAIHNLIHAMSAAYSSYRLAETRGLSPQEKEIFTTDFTPNFLQNPVYLDKSVEDLLMNYLPDLTLTDVTSDVFGEPVTQFNLWELINAIQDRIEDQASRMKHSERSSFIGKPELTNNEYFLMQLGLIQQVGDIIINQSTPDNFNFHFIFTLSMLLPPAATRLYVKKNKTGFSVPAKIFQQDLSRGDKQKLQERFQRLSYILPSFIIQTIELLADHTNHLHTLAKHYVQTTAHILENEIDYIEKILFCMHFWADFGATHLPTLMKDLKKTADETGDQWLQNLYQRAQALTEESEFIQTDPLGLKSLFPKPLEEKLPTGELDEQCLIAFENLFAFCKKKSITELELNIGPHHPYKELVNIDFLNIAIDPTAPTVSVFLEETALLSILPDGEKKPSTRKSELFYSLKEDGTLRGGLRVGSEIIPTSSIIDARFIQFISKVIYDEYEETPPASSQSTKNNGVISYKTTKRGPKQQEPKKSKRKGGPADTRPDTNPETERSSGQRKDNSEYRPIIFDPYNLIDQLDGSIKDKISKKVIRINKQFDIGDLSSVEYQELASGEGVYSFKLNNKYRLVAKLSSSGNFITIFVGSHADYNTFIDNL